MPPEVVISRLFLLLFVAIGLAAPVQSAPVEEIRALAIAGEGDRVEAMIERALEKPTVNVEDAVTAAEFVAEQSNRPFYARRLRHRAAALDPFPVASLGTLLDLTRGNSKRAHKAGRLHTSRAT